MLNFEFSFDLVFCLHIYLFLLEVIINMKLLSLYKILRQLTLI